MSKLSAYLHVTLIRIIIISHMKSLYPQMSRYLINESEIKLGSFIILPQSSFVYTGSFTIFIAIHVVHLNTV